MSICYVVVSYNSILDSGPHILCVFFSRTKADNYAQSQPDSKYVTVVTSQLDGIGILSKPNEGLLRKKIRLKIDWMPTIPEEDH